ncbi:hypothetical protein [Arsukibacterium perlucidum]|uniref:hypothetical protein n=1 Tax=Arsukibacterium perlucidum TaxID=368811 RepID=UPI0012FA501F|nr:hypothetical protein [Arsukibacterium perlucidum]
MSWRQYKFGLMPAERIAYYDIAGDYQEADNLLVDTHWAAFINPVQHGLRQYCMTLRQKVCWCLFKQGKIHYH